MSQEMSISMDVQDPYMAEPPGPQAAPSVNPLMKIHQYLRGRYIWAIATGLILGAVGGYLGYKSMPLKYCGVATIRIKPNLTPAMYHTLGNEGMGPMYDKFVETQRQLLLSRRVTDWAFSTVPEWKAVNHEPEISDTDFADALEVESSNRSEFILIKFFDKDARRAQTGANAVLEAYRNVAEDQSNVKRTEVREKLRTALMNAITDLQSRIKAIADEFGSEDLSRMREFKVDLLNRADSNLQNSKILLAYAQANAGQAATQPGTGAASRPAIPDKLSPEYAAALDPKMSDLLDKRNAAVQQKEMLVRGGMGPNHQTMRQTQVVIDQMEKEIKERLVVIQKSVDDWKASGGSSNSNASHLGGGPEISMSLDKARIQVEQITKLRDELKNDVISMGQKQLQIDDLKRQLNLKQQDLDAVAATIARESVESEVSQRVIYSESLLPNRPEKDRRLPVAAGASFGGLVLGIGVFVLVGFFDRRLKTVADARDSLDRSNRILGILPLLPEDLSDPEQSGSAAYCVHHIRTLLQIAGRGAASSTFAVTSASPGDGKTSLVISLGLSYAASGAKTLLIDSDLIGAGLTQRANAITRRKIGSILLREKRITQQQLDDALELSQRQGKRLGTVLVEQGFLKQEELERALSAQQESSLGLLDVLDGEPLADCIIPAWAPNLSILPVGNVGASHAGQISIRAVRRIVAEARSQYDVVLVDTGPILGSLEACIIGAAVDEVIVCVAQGQKRPLVEKTFARLREIGARVAGIVFNRAHVEDVELGGYMSSSVSQRFTSPNVREPSDRGSATRRLGPVARAVADSGTTPNPGEHP